MKDEDQALFEDNFGQWLEQHGVELGDLRPPNLFEATIDLNVLKLAVYDLVHEWREDVG